MEKFFMGGRIYSGKDSLQILGQIEPGKQVLVVTDSFMADFGYVKTLEEILLKNHIVPSVFTGVKPDPSTEIIADGVKIFEATKPDVLIALGGGSVIDAAKGIMYFHREIAEKSNQQWHKPLFIAIPTTSGTGSECTAFSVITSEKGKICIVEDWLIPEVAILSESYTVGVPEKITYDTGLDVLTHALEAYVSTRATAFTDALAEKAARMVFEYLPRLKQNLKDEEARKGMHEASCMVGIAFSQAGLGINHSLAHALGGAYHIPHGRANTVFLEIVMDYNVGGGAFDELNIPAVKYAKLAQLLGYPSRTIREGYMNLRAAVVDLKNCLQVPRNIQDLGVDEADLNVKISSMLKNVLEDRCTETAPRKPSVEEVQALYRNAYGRKY